MMTPGVRPWPALTEDNQNMATAAWSWLHHYFDLKHQGVQVGIGGGRLSKLIQPHTIIRRISDQLVVASLGNATWAGLGLPLVHFVGIEGQTYYKFKKKVPVHFYTCMLLQIGKFCLSWLRA